MISVYRARDQTRTTAPALKLARTTDIIGLTAAASDSMTNLRLMFVLDSLKAGGTERQVLLLSDALSRRGWEVRVVVLGPDAPLAKDPAASRCEVRSLGERGLLGALRGEVAGFAPHLLQTFSARPHTLCVALKVLGCAPRWVVGVRDAGALFAIRRPASLASDALVFRARFGVAAYVANSAAALHAKGLVPGPGAHILPNLLDPRFRPLSAPERARARRRFGFPADAFVVGAVCNTTPYKGLEILFEACATVAVPKLRLALAGEERGLYGKRLLRSARAKLGDRFTYLGLRDDVPDLMPTFDLYCSSSVSESSSNSVGEAMGSGVPCAVTDAGDSADLVGETGWVVPTRDAAALAWAIREAAESDPASLASRGAVARTRIEELWSPARTAAAYDNLYRGLALGPR
ncbi:glycosyltransferase [bacterium]|nr:MAG: glycosyltransferase [bacterium]